MNKIAKNYAYIFVYQIAAIIIPFITAPYLARILGAEGVGTYSFYLSVVSYFSMFVALGVSNYGNRCIARCLGDNEETNRVFSEILFMQLLCGIVVVVVYIIYAAVISNALYVYLLYLPYLLSFMIDISWYFFGKENFRLVVIRNIVIKSITTVLIFTFVKTEEDLNKYIIIMSVGYFVSQALIWPMLLKRVKIQRPSLKAVLVHFKPNLILFIPLIAVSIYRTMDKIMLGVITSNQQVGYYENAEKLISLLLSFITAIGTVMLPRMSALYKEKNESEIQSMLTKTTIIMTFMASGVAFGVAAISQNLVLWFYGDGFAGSISILRVLCITVPFICYANIIRMQILIPNGKDTVFVISSIVGAVLNICFNLILIPLLGGVGASIGTVIAELSVFIYQYVSERDTFKLRELVSGIVALWVSGAIMFAAVYFSEPLLPGGFIGILCQVVIGVIIYLGLIALLHGIMKDKGTGMLIATFKQTILRKKV